VVWETEGEVVVTAGEDDVCGAGGVVLVGVVLGGALLVGVVLGGALLVGVLLAGVVCVATGAGNGAGCGPGCLPAWLAASAGGVGPPRQRAITTARAAKRLVIALPARAP
jgi:hypothetical protein